MVILNKQKVEALGLFAGILGILAWIPQIVQVWVHREYKGISLPTLYLIAACIMMWIVYGVCMNAVAVIVCNCLVLACLGVVIYGVYYCKAMAKKGSRSQS